MVGLAVLQLIFHYSTIIERQPAIIANKMDITGGVVPLRGQYSPRLGMKRFHLWDCYDPRNVKVQSVNDYAIYFLPIYQEYTNKFVTLPMKT